MQAIMQTKRMKIHPLYNPKPKIDIGETISKSLLRDKLVRYLYKFAKSVTETSNKVRKPKTYNKVINHPIHGNRWCKAMNKKLWNLDSY